MDAAHLTGAAFWADSTPLAATTAGTAGSAPAAWPDLPGRVWFASSGSSGTPRWVALSKPALLASAAAVNSHLGVTAASCWGLALPLHHVGGFGVAARAYAAGCAWRQFAGPWEAAAFSRWLADSRVTHTSLVPAQVHDLVAAGLDAPASLRAVVVGGGQLAAATGQAARGRGWPVLASYGLTEAASQVATQGLEALAQIYHPAPLPLLPIWQAEISPQDHLRIAGPALFCGLLVYRDERWIYQPRDSHWHPTADRAALDGRWLTPLGRADLRVKVMGELVDPEAIEAELCALCGGTLPPGTFAVVAIADARAEHALVPVFDASVPPDLIAAVLSAYAAIAPGFRRLRPAVTLAPMPRSPLGKPLRTQILARLRLRPKTTRPKTQDEEI